MGQAKPSPDPIIDVVNNGIKRDVQVTLENKCFRATLILVYCGMDTMAFLGLPEERNELNSADFIAWAESYIRFPCNEQLTGPDLYGARCATLHTYGSESRLSRAGKCRQIGYMDRSIPEVRFAPDISRELVLVSVPALVEAFLKGVDTFLVDVFADTKRGRIAEKRFEKILHQFPTNGLYSD